MQVDLYNGRKTVVVVVVVVLYTFTLLLYKSSSLQTLATRTLPLSQQFTPAYTACLSTY